jgi:hypothetical protein
MSLFKGKLLSFIFLIFCSSLLMADQEFIYQAMTQGTKVKANWKIEEKENKLLVSGQNKGRNVFLECSSSYSFLSFTEKVDQDREFKVSREGSTLKVQFKEKGKEKTKNYDIGQTPWIQEFKFGFQPFLSSNQKEYKFYIINPKDLGLHGMVATKEQVEELTIEGKKYLTQKLKVTLQGFKKKFWRAEVWFDQETQMMVKYKANEGPGTPTTEITLLPKA